jgi:hypothetical protein
MNYRFHLGPRYQNSTLFVRQMSWEIYGVRRGGIGTPLVILSTYELSKLWLFMFPMLTPLAFLKNSMCVFISRLAYNL